jgi:sugar/nucleoside kinase (ribokinase family)
VADRLPGRPTASSHIVVVDGLRTVYRSEESASEVWDIPASLDYLEPLSRFDHLSLGHLPSDRDGQSTRRVIRTARAAGVPVSWTPGQTQLRRSAAAFADSMPWVDLLILNREEATQFGTLPSTTEPGDAARALAIRAGGRTTVVVTDGGRSPAVAYDPDTSRLLTAPLVPVTVVDPSGAGDCFNAHLTLGRLRGLDLGEALDLASRRAAETCTYWGCVARTQRSVVTEA